jgi:hypothetical protein
MEVYSWSDPSPLAGLRQWARLVGSPPRLPIRLSKYQILGIATDREAVKIALSVIRQNDVARLPGLADTDLDCACVRAVVGNR